MKAALLRIGTPLGVRLEYFQFWPGCEEVVLHPGNGFCAIATTQQQLHHVRVGCWDADQCSVAKVSAAKLLSPPISKTVSYDASGSEPEDTCPKGYCTAMTTRKFHHHTKRRRLLKPPPKPQNCSSSSSSSSCSCSASSAIGVSHKPKNKYCMIASSLRNKPPRPQPQGRNQRKVIEIGLPDRECNVLYVWVLLFEDHTRIAPHPQSEFRVENCCGACTSLFDLDFGHMKKLATAKRKGVTGDQIATLGGTFTLCAERYQVNFRGVRSMRDMESSWALISGRKKEEEEEESHVGIYLAVLKAQLGFSILLTAGLDHGAKLDPDCATETCYIANKMRLFCSQTEAHSEVCDTIALKGIRWCSLLRKEEVAPQLLVSKSSLYLSKRGGVMLRLIFPKGTPWSLAAEESVLSTANLLLDVLRMALRGKAIG